MCIDDHWDVDVTAILIVGNVIPEVHKNIADFIVRPMFCRWKLFIFTSLVPAATHRPKEQIYEQASLVGQKVVSPVVRKL